MPLFFMAWTMGVACQLMQARLWSIQAYLWVLAAMVTLLVWGLALRPTPMGRRFDQLPRVDMLPVLLVVCAALTGFASTGWRATIYQQGALSSELEAVPLLVTGRVVGLPLRDAKGQRFLMAVDAMEVPGGPEVGQSTESPDLAKAVPQPPDLIQLSWSLEGVKGGAASTMFPSPGETWRMTVRLKAPHGLANPHGQDRERWYWEQGIRAVGHVVVNKHVPTPRRLTEGQGDYLARARLLVATRIAERLDNQRVGGVMAALVVGDQAAVARDDWNLFRVTGVSHLMSISGLHVTLFAWLAMRLVAGVWRLTARRWPILLLKIPAPTAGGWGGLALATAYALFAGWGVPAQRTLLMLAVVQLLRLLGRRWPWPVVWSMAMWVVVVQDPWSLLQPGFWLSFVAVGVLFAADPGRSGAGTGTRDALPFARRMGTALTSMLAEQATVTAALAPLGVMLFGQFSIVGLVVNLLAIPWVTLVVTPLSLSGVLMPLIWHAAGWSVQAMLSVLDWAAAWEAGVVYLRVAPFGLSMLAVLGGVILALRLPIGLRIGGLGAILPALFWVNPRPDVGQFDVLALDVGQGSAVLVRTAHHSVLFDTGPSYRGGSDAGDQVIVPVLRAMGEHLDAVIVSHSDADHAGGSTSVAKAFPHARWLTSYDHEGAGTCHSGQGWIWDGVEFEIVRPVPADYEHAGNGRKPLSSNAMSCVLKVGKGDRASVLLTGDMDARREVELVTRRPDLRAGLLLSPHHGSHTSSSPVLLNVVRPKWAIIQSGYLNAFRHPASVVIQRYEARGIRWTNSPVCGAAAWRSDEPDDVVCWRQTNARYWQHSARNAYAHPRLAPGARAAPHPVGMMPNESAVDPASF